MGRLIPAGTGLPAYKKLQVVIDEKSPTYAPPTFTRVQAPTSTLLDIGTGIGVAALTADVVSFTDDQDTQKYGRIGGWVLVSAFVASALYGTYVIIECQSSEPVARRRAEQARRLTPTTVAGFPGTVLQFQFGTTTEVAGRACVAAGSTFEPGAAYSLCRSSERSLARPDARLEFRAAHLSRVTLVYPATPETMQATLAQIENRAASYYGQPRSGPNAWPAACASNGAVQCLKDGELPGRAFWSFSEGDIELRPSLDSESPLIELRYTLYEPGG